MSRSYKKTPIHTDGGAHNTSKKYANKKVRHSENVPLKGKSYKKYFCSWDIHDYKSRWTLREAILDWEYNFYNEQDDYASFKDYLKHWAKYYKRK